MEGLHCDSCVRLVIDEAQKQESRRKPLGASADVADGYLRPFPAWKARKRQMQHLSDCRRYSIIRVWHRAEDLSARRPSVP